MWQKIEGVWHLCHCCAGDGAPTLDGEPGAHRSEPFEIRNVREVLAMVGMLLLMVGLAALGLAVALGWTPDSRRPDRYWYPAGPDRPDRT